MHGQHICQTGFAYRRDERDCVPRGRRLRERVERPEDLPAAIERSLKVMRREKRQTLLNVICGV